MRRAVPRDHHAEPLPEVLQHSHVVAREREHLLSEGLVAELSEVPLELGVALRRLRDDGVVVEVLEEQAIHELGVEEVARHAVEVRLASLVIHQHDVRVTATHEDAPAAVRERQLDAVAVGTEAEHEESSLLGAHLLGPADDFELRVALVHEDLDGLLNLDALGIYVLVGSPAVRCVSSLDLLLKREELGVEPVDLARDVEEVVPLLDLPDSGLVTLHHDHPLADLFGRGHEDLLEEPHYRSARKRTPSGVLPRKQQEPVRIRERIRVDLHGAVAVVVEGDVRLDRLGLQIVDLHLSFSVSLRHALFLYFIPQRTIALGLSIFLFQHSKEHFKKTGSPSA